MPFPECSHSSGSCASVISGEEWDKYYAGDVRARGPRILTTSLPLPVMVKGLA